MQINSINPIVNSRKIHFIKNNTETKKNNVDNKTTNNFSTYDKNYYLSFKGIKEIDDRKAKHYSFTKKLISIVINKSNILTFASDSALQDIKNLVFSKLSQKELEILEVGDVNSEEFKQLVPEGIKTRIRDCMQTKEFANICNSHYLALLSECCGYHCSNNNFHKLTEENTVSPKELAGKISDQYSSKVDIDSIESTYNIFKSPLNKLEVLEIKNKLLSHNQDFDYSDEDKLTELIQSQGKYLKLILSENSLQQLTEISFWELYNKVNNKNYLGVVAQNYTLDKFMQNSIDKLNSINFDDMNLVW